MYIKAIKRMKIDNNITSDSIAIEMEMIAAERTKLIMIKIILILKMMKSFTVMIHLESYS